MQITITLNSPAIQEKFDRGGIIEIADVLNKELGYSTTYVGLAHDIDQKVGEVYDENGNVAGTWEVRG